MGFLGLGKLAGSLLFGGLGAILGKKKKQPQVIQPREVRRDEMKDEVAQGDALRRRKGAAADMITGVRGAEAAASSVGRLVVGS